MPWTHAPVAASILREMEAQRRRLGERLRDLRKGRGWSQEDAAHAVGVGVKTWHTWEAGKRTPYDSNLRKIGAAFDVDPSSLMDRPAPLGLVEVDDSPPVWARRLEEKLNSVEAANLERAVVARQVQELVAQQNDLLERQSEILANIEALVLSEKVREALREAAQLREQEQRALEEGDPASGDHREVAE